MMRCPSCGSTESGLVQRKYFVTELRKCRQCKLLYRYPTDSEEDNSAFYQNSYDEGFTTNLPSEAELKILLLRGFQGHEKDSGTYLEVMRALKVRPGSKVIDFGCSWGYGSWQLQQAGFSVQGYEISRARNTGVSGSEFPLLRKLIRSMVGRMCSSPPMCWSTCHRFGRFSN